MNTIPYYLLLLFAMSLFLQGGTCFFAVINISRKIFVPFIVYSTLLGVAFLFGLLAMIPGMELIFNYLRFPVQIVAFFFLAEFSLLFFGISRKIRAISYLTMGVLLLIPPYLMNELGKAELLSLFMISIPTLPLSAVALWKQSNTFQKFEASFKIASVFHFGNGIAILTAYLFLYHTLPERIQLEKEASMILLSFALLCTLLCSGSFLTLLKALDFPNKKIRYLTYLLTPVVFLLFAVAGWFVPSLFQSFGENIAAIRINGNATLLMEELRKNVESIKKHVRIISEEKSVIQILQENKIRKQISGESGILINHLSASDPTVIYLLNPHGLCIDSSNYYDPHTNFIGQDFSFAKYFKLAMKNGSAVTMAAGAISRLPCAFAAIRVDDPQGKPLGIVAARHDISSIPNKFPNSYAALISPENTVLFTNTSRLSTKFVKWEIGLRWLCPQGELYRERYIDGIMFIEQPCMFLSEQGWRLILGIPTTLPAFSYLLGQVILLLFWILTLCMISIYILQLKIRIQIAAHSSWRDTVFNNNTAGIVVVDMNRHVIDVNETFIQMLGYSLNELQKLGLEIIYPNGSASRAFLETISNVFQEGKTYENSELRLRRKNGTAAVFHVAGCCFQNEFKSDAIPLRGIVWTITDQTRELEETSRLKEREEMFRSIVENSGEHIFLLDSHGFFIYSNNRQIATLMKDNPAPLHLKDMYDPQTASLYMNMLDNVFMSGTPLSFQHTVKKPGGKSLVMDVLYPVRRDGVIYAAGGIARDITSFRVQENSLV